MRHLALCVLSRVATDEWHHHQWWGITGVCSPVTKIVILFDQISLEKSCKTCREKLTQRLSVMLDRALVFFANDLTLQSVANIHWKFQSSTLVSWQVIKALQIYFASDQSFAIY